MATKLERITITLMEPNISGDGITYYERELPGNAWRCDECGLVWDRKGYAEGCTGRGHKQSFVQKYYGAGAMVNGRFTGTVTVYERVALRRDDVRVAVAS